MLSGTVLLEIPSFQCSFVLAIKNTFIDVEEESFARPPRRHSCPPRARKSESPYLSGFDGDESDYAEEDQHMIELQQSFKQEALARHEMVQQPPPMPFPSDFEARCQEVRERMACLSASDFDSGCSTVVRHREVSEDHFDSGCSTVAHHREVSEDMSTDATVRSDVEAGCKLDSSAAPFVPGPPKGITFHQEVFAVADEVAEVLRQHECAPDMHASLSGATDDEGVTTLTMMLGLEHQDRSHELLSLAKETFFAHTNRSRGVCLIGYKKTPFKTTETGFTSSYASVSRKRQACRQFYANGRCRYEKECWWHHPETVSSINFVVEICA